jgi:hypothetical protein
VKGSRFFVVDAADRIDSVSEDYDDNMVRFLGHSLWEYLPGVEPVLGPYFEDARKTGAAVETTVFYAGGTIDLRIVPSGRTLAVHSTRRMELDVRTLATLAQSLRAIEDELVAREPVRHDLPAPASLQALP